MQARGRERERGRVIENGRIGVLRDLSLMYWFAVSVRAPAASLEHGWKFVNLLKIFLRTSFQSFTKLL